MNNKKFLLVAIVVVIAGFIALTFFNQEPPTPEIKRISVDTLIKFHSPTKGAKDAPIAIVEFLDPECEACRAMHPILKQLLQEYEGKVRLVIRYMPLHTNSVYAAAVLEEARELGKYEEALDILFQKQPEWGNHHNPMPELIPGFLEGIGIPKERLERETVIAKHGAKIEIDRLDGVSVGANRTPTFFVNGVILDRIGYDPLRNAIEAELKRL
jgi:protein-disulfide isomerase